MENEYINITPENIDEQHLCCIIRSRKPHPGVEAKRRWLAERLAEGHIFRKLNVKGCVFIEYAPLEKAWVPIIGENFVYIYCLWVGDGFKGKGYAKELMEYCISEAKKSGSSGICMLGAKKQKHWLSSQSFAAKYGFVSVDSTESGYELLALSFDGISPRFSDTAKKCTIDDDRLTIYYDAQCPYIYQHIEDIKKYCGDNDIPLSLIYVDTLEKAKALPCVFNNFGVFYKGKFETVNLIDTGYIERLLKK